MFAAPFQYGALLLETQVGEEVARSCYRVARPQLDSQQGEHLPPCTTTPAYGYIHPLAAPHDEPLEAVLAQRLLQGSAQFLLAATCPSL